MNRKDFTGLDLSSWISWPFWTKGILKKGRGHTFRPDHLKGRESPLPLSLVYHADECESIASVCSWSFIIVLRRWNLMHGRYGDRGWTQELHLDCLKSRCWVMHIAVVICVSIPGSTSWCVWWERSSCTSEETRRCSRSCSTSDWLGWGHYGDTHTQTHTRISRIILTLLVAS